MYLPRQPKKPQPSPFRPQASMRTFYAGGAMVLLSAILSAIFSMQAVQRRDRRAQRELRQKRPGQRVVIVGAGAGGAALAASLCSSTTDVHVTVIETDKKQTFMSIHPLACVGHRSYDLNTSGGIDFLRSPASWNVTRDAHLVAGEVVKVLTDRQEVVVAPAEGTAATLWGPGKGKHGAGQSTARTAEAPVDGKRKEDTGKPATPYRELDGGLQAYPYDVLVVACGAKRTLGPLEGLLPHGLAEVDRHGIAVNPGVTRDSLAHLFRGNVVHVKVPPKSFYELVEADRKTRPPAVVMCDCSASTSGLTEGSAFFSAMDKLSGIAADSSSSSRPVRERGDGLGHHNGHHSRRPPPLHPYMFATSRQHDGTFVSTTNMMWKYLDCFGKLGYCQLLSVTADADPLGVAPVEANDAVRELWKQRRDQSRRACHPSLTGGDNTGADVPARFHFLHNSYLTAVDPTHQVVTLYNHSENALLTLPYRLLLLDLPLTAPSFLRESGLARGEGYARDAAPEFLWASRLPFLRRGRVPRHVQRAFDAEGSFMDVDPATLQHRRFPNVFALGDVAGLPTVKSYGATLAQVPVVAHNVKQLLYNARARELVGADEAKGGSGGGAAGRGSSEAPRGRQSSAREFHPRTANARYDGYSSFPVMMTTWRVMWPEMVFNPALLSPPPEDSTTAATDNVDLSRRLTHCNGHLWDNLAWRDVRGFANGVFVQSMLYESLHFFLFNRGVWYPPSWFSVPTYSVTDGTKEQTRRGWFGFL